MGNSVGLYIEESGERRLDSYTIMGPWPAMVLFDEETRDFERRLRYT